VETVFTGVCVDQAQYPPELYTTYVMYGLHLEDAIHSTSREEAEECHRVCVRDIQGNQFL